MSCRTCLALGLALLAAAPETAPAQEARTVLVVTAGSGDYMLAAGGTLAKLIRDEGYTIHVAQMGNDEKLSSGMTPAQARLANVEDGKQAAKLLGITKIALMGHKSGELGYVSSTEMRKQLFGLIRHLKPEKIFFPDQYVHYLEDWDQHWVGKSAEGAAGYSGAGTFANELERMGLGPYGAPENYFYAVQRPYRSGEGGEGRASFLGVDITSTLEQKIDAIELLRNRNRFYALMTKLRLEAAGRPSARLSRLDDLQVRNLVRTYVEQLATTIGTRHGFEYGEEFNYVGRGPAIPPHALERAVPKR